MNKQFARAVFCAAICLFASASPSRGQATAPPSAPAQAATDKGITPRLVFGEITDLNAAERRMTLRTDAGNTVAVAMMEATVYKRVPPGDKTVDRATPIALADLGVGDRVIARGVVEVERKAAAAREVIVMTRADLTAKRESEQAAWRGGVVGTVTAVNPATKEITVKPRTRGFMGGEAPPVVVEANAPDIIFRRYAPDSVRFQDAKTSSFDDLKPGDQLRARGERSPDGARFVPQEVVSGAFRTIVGTVATVAADGASATLTPMGGGAPVTVRVKDDSTLRRLPEGGMGMMGGDQRGAAANGGASAGAPGMTPGAGRPQGAGTPGAAGGGGGMGGGRGVDFSEMLERLPQLKLADLKPGDMVLVSSTATGDASQMTAIALVAGVERFVNAMQSAPQGARQGANPSLGTGLPGGLDLGIGGP